MKIFEDLIEELKEENLLEETVIETSQAKEREKNLENNLAAFDDPEAREAELFLKSRGEFTDEELNGHESAEDLFPVEEEFPAEEFLEEEFPDEITLNEADDDEKMPEGVETASVSMNEFAFAAADGERTAAVDAEPSVEAGGTAVETVEETPGEEYSEQNKPSANSVEFYRQRAMKEVSGLQMVEHVLSGVEREQMKIVPKPYDDLEAKKILHHFLQVSKDLNSPEHAQAEFALMQETESWYSALSRRDKNVSVTHLRRYCETTRPILSSQALIAIARFYRNSPYSDQVRSKFDLVITRLFTKEIENEKRQIMFERPEMIEHLTTLYGEWASVPLYAASDDDSEILLIALRFEEFMQESDDAKSFDELIKNDFFNRLRVFKESTNENFFAPLVTAAAIECNVRIGNRYVDLIQQEKKKMEAEKLQDKYGFLHDQSISEAASKTLHLVDLLKQKSGRKEDTVSVEPESKKTEQVQAKTQPSAAPEKPEPVEEKKPRGKFAVNKWLLLTTILIVVVNIGLYMWMSYGLETENISQNVKKVNLENSSLKDFIRDARISSDTFFAITQPNWAGLSTEKKEEVLKKIYATGSEKGFTKVQLIGSDGKNQGYADAESVSVY